MLLLKMIFVAFGSIFLKIVADGGWLLKRGWTVEERLLFLNRFELWPNGWLWLLG